MSFVKSLILAVAMVAVLGNRAAAQSGCTVALMSLSPCINYVSGNSSTPSSSCCSSLSSVVGTQPQCLCALLKGGGASNLGFTVNQTLALALPGTCKVQTPPLSRCDAANGPSTEPAPSDSPTGSPADEKPQDPTTPSSVPDVPSSTGSKTVPSTTEGSSNAGSNVGARVSILGALVVMAASSWAFSLLNSC